jgi:hypothetical protein
MAEKEYIERSELIRYAEVELRMQGDLFRRAVESCPTADVVEVVRCKDCKYYDIFALACKKPNFNGWIGHDGYCSHGERREQG